MKDNRRKIGIGIAVCACVLLIGAGLYLTRNNKQETQESPDSAFVPDLDPDASNDRNGDTISIECCHPDDTGAFNTVTYQYPFHC